jgi:adenosylcobinamide-GDP ribazoletransferase
MKTAWVDFLSAIQFLTRIPIPSRIYEADSLPRSAVYFPFVGLLIGGSAALLQALLVAHVTRMISALIVLTYLAAITGCLHEDGLADTADGLGGGRNREQALHIMRDSRIGTYGAITLILSLLLRFMLLSALPLIHVWQYLIAAHVLCRWSTLPLSFFFLPARATLSDSTDGQGARVARRTTRGTLIFGSLFTLTVVVLILRMHALVPIAASVLVTLGSGLYYRHRLGGITGDCFGATNQLSEIAVYLCGAWGA